MAIILSLQELFLSLVCLLAAYVTALSIYRLYFSPLARFPGPKLAAATLWYEFYYDVVKRGRYTWKIAELHAQYGAPSPCTPPRSVNSCGTPLQAQSYELVRMNCM